LEAFLGALYVDKDLEWCQIFANVCFFPRLEQFILNQDWNDPKSKLQQCCLTLRTMDGGEPDIPVYKIIESKGSTNNRVYTVAVYFRGERLAKDDGHSIQQAEMNAAKVALEKCAHLFPHLNYQKRMVEMSFKQQGMVGDIVRNNWYQETLKRGQGMGMDQEQAVKVSQEVVGRERQRLKADVIPIENIDTCQTVASRSETGTFKKDNKEAVRAEIREIEIKLFEKKQKKAGESIETDKEDGECSDSAENFDKLEVEKSFTTSASISDEISKKTIKNRNRRGDLRKGFEEGTGRASEGKEKIKNERSPHHSNKRDRRENSDSRDTWGRRGDSGYGRSKGGDIQSV